MSARRSHGSLGDLISTLVFSGMALLAFLTGFGALEAGEPWRAAGIWFTGFLCFWARAAIRWRGFSMQ